MHKILIGVLAPGKYSADVCCYCYVSGREAGEVIFVRLTAPARADAQVFAAS